MRILGLIFTTIIGSCTFAQQSNVRAYIQEKQFFAPDFGEYIEIQTQYLASSLKYIQAEGGIQSELLVHYIVKSKDSIWIDDEFKLKSPIFKDSIVEDFYDVKRYSLQPGIYEFTITLKDVNAAGESIQSSSQIEVTKVTDQLICSDLTPLESASRSTEESVFYKSGYTMIPRISNYYPQDINNMPIYFEVYNSDKLGTEVFGIRQHLINLLTGEELQEFSVSNSYPTRKVVPVLKNINIHNVPTGKYQLKFTLISKDMKEISTMEFDFERTNDIEVYIDPNKIILDPAFQLSIPKDSVNFYLASLIPIAKPAEAKNIIEVLKRNNVDDARKLIQAFWSKTAGVKAYDEWTKYKLQVMLVEKLYKTAVLAGFESDRGRVYLQYGPPTTVSQFPVSATDYPYEIWRYNQIGKVSNKLFVFYNPDLASNTYKLLHSDMIGEIKNQNWQQLLNIRGSSTGTSNIINPY